MSASTSLDKDLLDTLTPEERAAFDDVDPAEVGATATALGAVKDDLAGTHDGNEPDDDDGDDDGDDDAPGEPGAQPAAAPAAQEPEKASAATQRGADPAPAQSAAQEPAAPAAQRVDPPPVGAFQFALPDDFEERLTANKAARDSLFARLKEGEITLEDLQAEQSKLDDDRRDLDSMRIQRDIAAQSQAQAVENQRRAAIDRLFDAAAKQDGGGIDYRQNQAMTRDLDTFVRALASDDANADKSLDWFLAEGHRRVRALHGATTPPAAAPAAPIKTAPDQRRPRLDDVPKTLAHVPGGDGPGDVGGEFDDIMALDGDAYERAIEGMAKKDPARFARFQSAQQ